MSAGKLRFHPFGAKDPLGRLPETNQVQYLRFYLADLGATTVVEEPSYFDRDYLADFRSFYSTSTRGYPNVCSRLHFFSGKRVTRERLRRALAGSAPIRASLQDSYLGFVVIRPIPSPLGRTVLRWYDDKTPATPRVIEPAREYRSHLVGLPLRVTGLAWQQQDTAVSACATVALWSMLHSSGFDEQHAIPTTARITEVAHQTWPLGNRIFPSGGLTPIQICEAIKHSLLEPVASTGSIGLGGGSYGFSRDRFCAVLASLVRSGFPVLIGGQLEGAGMHAVCAVGFREPASSGVVPGSVTLQDGHIEHVYIHDDNLGPNVRFRIDVGKADEVVLRTDPPPARHALHLPDPARSYPALTPTSLVAAVPAELRATADAIHAKACDIASYVIAAVQLRPGVKFGLTASTRFARVSRFLDRDLPMAAPDPEAGAAARIELAERADPMSLHIGVARLGWDGVPLFDILFDTSDADRNLRVFATVTYRSGATTIAGQLQRSGLVEFGEIVSAHA